MMKNWFTRESSGIMIGLVILMLLVVGGCGQYREATLAGHQLAMKTHQSTDKDFYKISHVAIKDLTKEKMKAATTDAERNAIIDFAFDWEAKIAFLKAESEKANMIDHQTSIYIMQEEPFLSKTMEEWKEAYQDAAADSNAETASQPATTP
jgi:hypothetical protein